MESVLFLLCFFAVLKSLFMTSLLPGRWYRLAFSLSLGIFLLAAYPAALEVNKLELQRVLSGRSALTNISLAVTVDMLLSGYFCVARLQDHSAGASFRWYTQLFRHLPSLLVFPALYYIQITLFFTWPAFDFLHATLALAAGIVSAFGLASWGMRRLVAEKEWLVELVAILAFFVCILVICCTVFHPSSQVCNRPSPVDWGGCIATAGVVLGMMAAGYIGGYAARRYRQFRKSETSRE